MTKIKHPLNRLQRKQLLAKKNELVDEKKREKKAERESRVWRKLEKERLKEQETENELTERYRSY